VSRHAEAWRKLKQARFRVDLDADGKLKLVREWAQAFLEEKGDYALASFNGVYVKVSDLAREPEKHPEAVELILKIAGEGG
jgi:hypothetical protein